MSEPDLRPHQLLALRKLSNGKILDGGVGTGKSRVAVEYYMLHERPKHVYVITTARKRDDLDWEREFLRVSVGPLDGPNLQPHPKRGKTGGSGKRRAGSGDGGVVQGKPTIEDPARSNQDSRRTGNGTISSSHPETFRADIESDAGETREVYHALGSGYPQRLESDDGRDLVSESSGKNHFQEGFGTAADGPKKVESGTAFYKLGEAGTYPWVLKVDSWNNISKYADVEGAFFIFDEQRLVGSGSWSKAFLRISRRNNWILLTATPGDTWMDFVPVFVANGFYKNRTEFKHKHVVYSNFTKFPKIERYINQGRLVRQRAQLLVHMPYERHTRRRHVEVPLLYDKETLNRVLKDRWNVYTELPLRDVGEMFSVARRVVNSDPSRLEMVCELWKKHPRLIIFYSFNYELESLRSLKEYYGLTTPSNSSISSVLESKLVVPTAASHGPKETLLETSQLSGSRVTGTGSAGTSTLTRRQTATSMKRVATKDVPESSIGSTLSRINIFTQSSSPLQENRSSSRKMGGSTPPSGSAEWATNTSTSTAAGTANTSKSSSGGGLLTETHQRTSKAGCTDFSEKNMSLGRTSSGTESLTAKKQASFEESSTTVSIAEWNGHKHEPVPTTDRWLYLVQYTAGAEAWNCTTTDAMIMYSRHYSWKVIEQSEGRIDRMNTPFHDLWYYQFMTDSWIDRAIERAVAAKEVFNEAKHKGLMES